MGSESAFAVVPLPPDREDGREEEGGSGKSSGPASICHACLSLATFVVLMGYVMVSSSPAAVRYLVRPLITPTRAWQFKIGQRAENM